MGSLAEHFNSLLNVGVQYSGSAIGVKAPAEQPNGLLPLSKRDELARVPGVAAVYPQYQVCRPQQHGREPRCPGNHHERAARGQRDELRRRARPRRERTG